MKDLCVLIVTEVFSFVLYLNVWCSCRPIKIRGLYVVLFIDVLSRLTTYSIVFCLSFETHTHFIIYFCVVKLRNGVLIE